MDVSLSGNNRYRLNENAASTNDGKLFIFVKLTDSCMKTIETYLKQNKKSNSTNKSNIKFHFNGGEMSIPTNNGERKIYSFQISPENKTPEVFQCIKQINKDQLESSGIIEQRLNIHAQEDVYSMTKTKVTEYQKIEDSTKKQTKEIGESSKTILQKKTNKSSHHRLSTPLNNPKTQRTTTTINQDSHLSPAGTNHTSASERPLRERLVHLLAAKVYKKAELLLRLKFDGGIREEEKEQLDSILSSISTQSKAGEYFILKNILTTGEVNYDWPFYPKAEASSVRKKIKDLQANVNRSTGNKTTNETSSSASSTSTRPSLPISNTKTTGGSATTTTKGNVPSNSIVNRSRNGTENDQTTSSKENPLTDQRMQQLSDMLDKLTNAVSRCEKSDEELRNEMELLNEDDLDEAEREYNRLVPEYNQLIDYLKSVEEKYNSLEQQFNEEQNDEKGKKIVEEYFQCENENGFVEKRERVVQLHFRLEHIQKILQRNSPSNHLDFSEDDD